MQTNKFIYSFFLSFLVFIASSCSNNNEPTGILAQWKTDNDNYFLNMKDSVEFDQDTVMTNIGMLTYFYKITTQGDEASESPEYSDKVVVNYRGSLITGYMFDETYSGIIPTDSTSTPRLFYTNELIAGWTLNLMKMKAGESRTIVLPYQLAYGTRHIGAILPYSTLRFDIQLVSFAK